MVRIATFLAVLIGVVVTVAVVLVVGATIIIFSFPVITYYLRAWEAYWQ